MRGEGPNRDDNLLLIAAVVAGLCGVLVVGVVAVALVALFGVSIFGFP